MLVLVADNVPHDTDPQRGHPFRRAHAAVPVQLLQPIFPAEVMADKKAGRKDRPPGWPHPNEKGAGAIADMIIGLEDKD